MKVKAILRELRSSLEDIYPGGEANAIARLIFHNLKGWDTKDLIIHEGDEISSFIQSRIDEILGRLRNHEPIQYILGEARFYGMDLKVNRATLIPRHETEELADLIVADCSGVSDLRVLDVGTGSGAIAIALSRNLPFSKVAGLDISEEALKVAEENARKLHANIYFIHTDILDDSKIWMDKLPRNFKPDFKAGFKRDSTPDSEQCALFDIIVSNPPYVMESEKGEMDCNVLEHEPGGALFVSDENPLIFYREIATIGKETLAPGGRIYFEINPLQAANLKKLMEDLGYGNVMLHKDISHRERFLTAAIPAGD